MNISICNMGYSGYWAACWRELQGREGVNLRIYTPQTKYPYSHEFLDGLSVRIFDEEEMRNVKLVHDELATGCPDVLVISGWASKSFTSLVFDERFNSAKRILIVDASWEGSFRQVISRFILRKLVKAFDGIIVGGERGAKFARWIGFPGNRIYTSIYGYDAGKFDFDRLEWPQRFCFVGRYAPIKGVRTLVKAYVLYRDRYGDEAWPLDCYGSGALASTLQACGGVIDHGFLQPEALPQALRSAGVFVFPSLHEPWGVALAEACGSGLPAIVSDMVTSGDDLVEDGVNGYVVRAGDVGALYSAFCKMHENPESLSRMGAVSRQKAAHFAPNKWADRWLGAINDICR